METAEMLRVTECYIQGTCQVKKAKNANMFKIYYPLIARFM